MSVHLAKWLFGRNYSVFDLNIQALALAVLFDGHVATAILLWIALSVVSFFASDRTEMHESSSL